MPEVFKGRVLKYERIYNYLKRVPRVETKRNNQGGFELLMGAAGVARARRNGGVWLAGLG